MRPPTKTTCLAAFVMRARQLAVLLAWVLLAGCSAVPARTQPLKVVATVAPLADWTHRVGGDRVVVQTIVPVGVDPQTYEPTDQQRQQIMSADVVILNGLGLEPWLDDILARARSGQVIAELSQFVPPPQEPDAEPTPTTPVGDLPQVTPTVVRVPRPTVNQESSRYLWLNPRSAISQVDMIARTLTRADGAGFPVYRQNAARYSADIENIDTRFEREVGAWDGPTILSTDRFLYPFTQRYSLRLKVVGDDASADSATAPVFVNRFWIKDGKNTPLPTGAVILDPLGASNYEELMQTLLVSMTDALAPSQRGSIE